MYNNKTFLAVIPARAGSKGIPNKNIVKINGKYLIQYAIDTAIESKYLDKIIVSTDSIMIANIAKSCGADVPFLRPKELATDTAKTIDVLVHAVEQLKINKESYDYIVLLQPTQPLRQSFHIDEAIEKIANSKENSLVSVSEVREHPILMRTINEEDILLQLLNMRSTVRRQDFSKIHKVNGAIYINKLNEDFDRSLSLNDNKLAYIMDKKYDLDIDEPEDLSILKLRINNIT